MYNYKVIITGNEDVNRFQYSLRELFTQIGKEDERISKAITELDDRYKGIIAGLEKRIKALEDAGNG